MVIAEILEDFTQFRNSRYVTCLNTPMLHEPVIHDARVVLGSIEGDFELLKGFVEVAVGTYSPCVDGLLVVIRSGVDTEAREDVAARLGSLQERQAFVKRSFRFPSITEHHVKSSANAVAPCRIG